MIETLIKANEVERLVTPIFGDKEIMAVVAGQTVVLTIDTEFENKKQKNAKSAVDRLHGILEGTAISSYRFAKNKKYEIELEEEKFRRNRV
ncbi:MAG: hypothetical protein FWH22_05690 [Fibromonadales bacterium]|nr:hypothetical protein [Fibromonadales bacterium]